MRIHLPALLLLLVVAPAVATAQETDGEGEAEMLARLNAMRNAAELGTLERHAGLDAAARTHSADMAWHATLDHVSPRTGDPATRVRAAGVEARAMAENIAQNVSALEAHRALVASDPHRANMMNPRFTHVGLAVVVDDQRRVWVTEVFAELPDETETETDETPEAEVEVPVEAAPPTPQAAPAPQAAAAPQAVAPAGQPRVAGYWVQSNGQWYYYPLPPNAQPGQQLVPTYTTLAARPAPGYVVGGYRYGGYRPGYRVYPGAATHVVITGGVAPAPAFGWSPRRHYRYWVHTR